MCRACCVIEMTLSFKCYRIAVVIYALPDLMKQCAIQLCGPNGFQAHIDFVVLPGRYDFMPISSQPFQLLLLIGRKRFRPAYGFAGVESFEDDGAALMRADLSKKGYPSPNGVDYFLFPLRLSQHNEINPLKIGGWRVL